MLIYVRDFLSKIILKQFLFENEHSGGRPAVISKCTYFSKGHLA